MKQYLKEIHTSEEFDQICAADEISVFIFSADWCPDCRFLELFLEDVVNDYTKKGYVFYYVDRDQHIDLCQRLSILGIPSLLAYRKHQEIGRFVSKLRKTRPEIEAFLNSL